MKRKKLPPPKHTKNPTKRKKRISDSYLPDECWECVIGFIINDRSCLSSISLVSKQFLSITNRLLFSLTVKLETRPFLPPLFKRFTNVNTLNLTHFLYRSNDRYLDNLLSQLSTFPLKLTSLKLPDECDFPADGLQAFSQNITTLTSLTCHGTYIFCGKDLSTIVTCFPLLQELNLSDPHVFNNNQTNFVNTIHRLLSMSRIQHLNLCRTSFLKDQHVVAFSLFLGNLVSVNLSLCHNLTETTLFSLLRNCPLLSKIRMEAIDFWKGARGHPGVCPQLKSLYLGRNRWLSNEWMIMFASIFPNLQLLDLKGCPQISEGICHVLRKCCKLKHLNLASCSKVKLHGMNFAIPELEVLNLSNTSVDDETFYAISKNCCRILQLLLENCKGVTMKGAKQVVENCTQLRKIKLGRFRLSDENRKLLSRHGCHLC